MKPITSRENTRYKELLRLSRSPRVRREQGVIVLEGVHLVQAYMDRFESNPIRLFVKDSARNHPEVAALADRNEATVVLTDTLFDGAAPVQSPVGILAVAQKPTLKQPEDRDQGFTVLLDTVQDPGNLGAILRSAAAAGAVCAHLSPGCADPWSARALRSGMGAQFVIPIEQHDDLVAAAARLELPLVACIADAPTSVFDADLRGPIAFIIGGEGGGISPALVRQAHQLLRIPMHDGIESLNAAVAASVVFFERYRQLGRAADRRECTKATQKHLAAEHSKEKT